jgi:hypothetical protein
MPFDDFRPELPRHRGRVVFAIVSNHQNPIPRQQLRDYRSQRPPQHALLVVGRNHHCNSRPALGLSLGTPSPRQQRRQAFNAKHHHRHQQHRGQGIDEDIHPLQRRLSPSIVKAAVPFEVANQLADSHEIQGNFKKKVP